MKVFDIVWEEDQGKKSSSLPSEAVIPESKSRNARAVIDYLEKRHGAVVKAFCERDEPAEQAEIAKTLMLSTACITEETAKVLDRSVTEKMCGINVYPKIGLPLETILDAMPEEIERESYGWWIHVPQDSKSKGLDELKGLPSDLFDCIKYADEHGCDWICFDSVYDTVSGLPEYEW